ncbi:MAG: hypothetical protein K8T90_18630 [Planctomycetes bacterium]|nr:hypothetical protein [Planctomycetota bacterium]
MIDGTWPPIPTRNGFVRLKFPSLQDWSGTVHVTGNSDDPGGSLVVHVMSDAAFQGVPLDVRIEESADGVNWVERADQPSRTDVAVSAPTRARRDRRHG